MKLLRRLRVQGQGHGQRRRQCATPLLVVSLLLCMLCALLHLPPTTLR